MENDTVKHLKNLLNGAQKIVVIPHHNPDGDAMGSCLALYQLLCKQEKDVNLIAPNDYPHFLKKLAGSQNSLNFEEDTAESIQLIDGADLIFTLDFNQLSRTAKMADYLEKSSADFVMIDHHQQPGDYAAVTISNTAASSTCELLYDLCEELSITGDISPAIATCIYTGILTDTGSFKHASTTSNTHRVASQLIEAGARPHEIHSHIFDGNSLTKLKLQGQALRNLEVVQDFHTSFSFLSDEDLNDENVKKGDTEGIVNYGLSIDGIKFTALFKERLQEDIIKISLRSKGDVDVNTIARKHFDGGGHKNAAGGKSDDSLKDTLEYFKNTVLPEYKNKLQ